MRRGRSQEINEWKTGVAKAWKAFASKPMNSDLGPMGELVHLVRNDFNQDLVLYPGSPLISLKLLRSQDRATFFELHTSDVPLLQWNCNAPGRHVMREPPKIKCDDGFAGLGEIIKDRRIRNETESDNIEEDVLMAFIDPPYEVKTEYDRVVDAVLDYMHIDPSITIALWYPLILGRESAQEMVNTLCSQLAVPWVDVREEVPNRGKDLQRGLWGSGVLVINPMAKWIENIANFEVGLKSDTQRAFGNHILTVCRRGDLPSSASASRHVSSL